MIPAIVRNQRLSPQLDLFTPPHIDEAFVGGVMAEGKPLDCIGIPLQAQVGKHDFRFLTPKEARDKGFLMEDGEVPKAHLGTKFVYPHDWTKTKHDVCVQVYTDLEARLLASLRRVRDNLVQAKARIDRTDSEDTYIKGANREIEEALKIVVETLGVEEVQP